MPENGRYIQPFSGDILVRGQVALSPGRQEITGISAPFGLMTRWGAARQVVSERRRMKLTAILQVIH